MQYNEKTDVINLLRELVVVLKDPDKSQEFAGILAKILDEMDDEASTTVDSGERLTTVKNDKKNMQKHKEIIAEVFANPSNNTRLQMVKDFVDQKHKIIQRKKEKIIQMKKEQAQIEDQKEAEKVAQSLKG